MCGRYILLNVANLGTARVGDVQRAKQEKIRAETPIFPFKPSINDTFVAPAGSGDVTTRLLRPSMIAAQKKQKMKEEIAEKEATVCTFAPKVTLQFVFVCALSYACTAHGKHRTNPRRK